MRQLGSTDEPAIPCDCFDFVIGSGAGALLALMVGRLGMGADEALERFASVEHRLFPVVGDTVDEKAREERLKELKKLFGEELMLKGTPRSGGSLCRVSYFLLRPSWSNFSTELTPI